MTFGLPSSTRTIAISLVLLADLNNFGSSFAPSYSITIPRSKLTALNVIESGTPKRRSKARRVTSFPKRAVRIYTDYASRLWAETNPEARRKIAHDKAAAAIRQVQHIIRGDEYVKLMDVSDESRNQLLQACQGLLDDMYGQESESLQNGDQSDKRQNGSKHYKKLPIDISTEDVQAMPKKRRSVLFGVIMGLVVAIWVFSGNYIFTGGFTLMTILGQLEYYRLVQSTGVYPARRISVVGACSMFLTALFVPEYHQICLPLFGLWAMIWFLTMKRTITTIPEIAATFSGMFYLGYVPSFWVRIRLIGAGREPTRLAPIAAPVLKFITHQAEAKLPAFIPQAIHLPITTGAIFLFWTWLSLAFSDVGAYFIGKTFGKTKLNKISPAAGATSPNKTVEGVLGGCAVCAALSILGAWVQRWPWWFLTGAIHGILLGLLGLIGDLTASMMKRDAGLKDFGDLLPEHGGILDRVDSFVWAAPYSWLVCGTIIPALKEMCR